MTIAELVREAALEQVGYSADECLKCNVCNTVCPVARVTDLFPGPKYVGPQAARFRMGHTLPAQAKGLPRLASPDRTVDWCSGCGCCTAACPAGVKVAEMNSQARARLREGKRPKLRDWGFGQTDLMGRVAVPISPISNFAMRNRLVRLVMEYTIGVHRDAPIVPFAKRSFQSTWKRRRRSNSTASRFSQIGSNGPFLDSVRPAMIQPVSSAIFGESGSPFPLGEKLTSTGAGFSGL